MSRATLYRIIGFAFLVFAAVAIYQGEFATGRGGGGTVITRAHDPDAFWRQVVILIAIGCGLLMRAALRGRAGSLTPRLTTTQRSKGNQRRHAQGFPTSIPTFAGWLLKRLRASVLD